MPDYPRYSLMTPLPPNWEDMGIQEQARVLMHIFLSEGRAKMPGLTRIVVEYTGSGDSFENAMWYFYGDTDKGQTYLVDFSQPMHALLDEFANSCANQEHPGWENNDGGFGTITFDLDDLTCSMIHSERYVTSEDYGPYDMLGKTSEEE